MNITIKEARQLEKGDLILLSTGQNYNSDEYSMIEVEAVNKCETLTNKAFVLIQTESGYRRTVLGDIDIMVIQ